ncbi:exodeoxyribonuclease V subunit alpha [Chromatiaceae bacterium AAb-1]|nr:exodeoxyribonuclease V subunit alpha [Chromatiaceae bacterium AAb-1]
MTDYSRLRLLRELDILRPVDLAFINFLQKNSQSELPELLLVASALTSLQLGKGHICLDLQQLAADPLSVIADEQLNQPAEKIPFIAAFKQLTIAGWTAALAEFPGIIGNGQGNSPLVLNGARLYLRRYWQYEQQISEAILRRLKYSNTLAEYLPQNILLPLLTKLFPEPAAKTDWQQVGCALACRSAFAVITGGPGTGKTTTVVKLLALLQLLQQQQQLPLLNIRLAAPTGKAAARLKESISSAIDNVQTLLGGVTDISSAVPSEVATLHRLLGARDGSRQFNFNHAQKLPADVLVIDEASMVDVEMMAKVLQALPEHARLILLGDKDQLASVEAGAVLGELCQRAEKGYYLPETANWLLQQAGQQLPAEFIDKAATVLDQHITMLRNSYRFNSEQGIGLLASAVNKGQYLADVWQKYPQQLQFIKPASPKDDIFRTLILDGGALVGGFRRYLQQVNAGAGTTDEPDNWAADVLNYFSRFQLLCATRQGSWGTEQINQLISDILHREKLIDNRHQWYHGRPVMVTRNDYNLGLMNGDIGICLSYPLSDDGQSAVLRVAFPRTDGQQKIRWVLPSRLTAVETVFAMTVHKSQGSEFQHTVLVLPDTPAAVLSRELIYTAITRAAEQFTLVCAQPDILQWAIGHTTERAGGLSLTLENPAV